MGTKSATFYYSLANILVTLWGVICDKHLAHCDVKSDNQSFVKTDISLSNLDTFYGLPASDINDS